MARQSDVLPALNDHLLRAAKAGTEYRLTETGPFLEQINRLHSTDRTRLRARLEAAVFPQLRLDPRTGHVRKIRDDGTGPELWGFYLGNWTVTYEVHAASREVLLIGVTQKESTVIRRR